jgi:dihydrofolate reductase
MSDLKIEILVATDFKNGFAKENIIPWKIHRDISYFKNITTATPDSKNLINAVIMGRKTYESMGRLLPNRINIILTTKKNYIIPVNETTKGIVCNSYEDALHKCSTITNLYKVFIIGGEHVYLRAIKTSNVRSIYKTIVHGDFYCDTFFPDVSACYTQIATSVPESEGKYNFHFELWEKRPIK